MSLTGNMELSEMKQRKLQWKTLDDDKQFSKNISYEINQIVDVEPQRIRVF